MAEEEEVKKRDPHPDNTENIIQMNSNVETAYQDLLQMLTVFGELDKMVNFKDMKVQMKMKKQLEKNGGLFIQKMSSDNCWSPRKWNNRMKSLSNDLQKVDKYVSLFIFFFLAD